jgi:hypothetical protein
MKRAGAIESHMIQVMEKTFFRKTSGTLRIRGLYLGRMALLKSGTSDHRFLVTKTDFSRKEKDIPDARRAR